MTTKLKVYHSYLIPHSTFAFAFVMSSEVETSLELRERQILYFVAPQSK